MSNLAGAQLEASTLWPSVYRTEAARHACYWKRKAIILPRYNNDLPGKLCSLVQWWCGCYVISINGCKANSMRQNAHLIL